MGAVKGKSLQAITCPLCDMFSGKRLTSFEKHLNEAHNTTSKELWDSLNEGPVKCACGCNKETRWVGWLSGYSRVINGHNGFIYSVHSKEKAESIKKKRSDSLKGKTSWSKGLTKESDERIKKRAELTSKGRKSAFESGKLESWNKGLTKETDSRINNAATNLKEMFKSGELVPWAKGLTKETDIRIEKMSINVSLALQKKELREHLDNLKRLDLKEVKSRIESSGNFELIDGLQNYTNRSSKVITVACKTCKNIFHGSINSLWNGRCFSCSPGGSKAQEDVFRWIKSLGVNATINDRKTIFGFELDISCPDEKIAIEYNGLYWHSYINKSKEYHNNKSKECQKKGIKLIHVFEDEWRDSKNAIKTIILEALNRKEIINKNISYKEINTIEAKEFFKKNHPEGDASGMFKSFGAFLGEKLIAAAGIRKITHIKSKEKIEICRLCSDSSTIFDDYENLFKNIIVWSKTNGFKKILITSETRLGNFNSKTLKENGFIYEKKLPTEWWWTDFENRFNRFKYRANKAKGLTESQVAERAGVVKIWGCENIVYSLDL